VSVRKHSRFADEEKHGRNIAKACIVSVGRSVGVLEGQTIGDVVLGSVMSRRRTSANRSKAWCQQVPQKAKNAGESSRLRSDLERGIVICVVY